MTESDRLFHKGHLWLLVDGALAYIGITKYAQRQLGQVLYVDLPEPEAEVVQGESFGVIESAKVVSELLAPASGKVIAINTKLKADPAAIYEDPYGDGWIIKILWRDRFELKTLMSGTEYAAYLTTSG